MEHGLRMAHWAAAAEAVELVTRCGVVRREWARQLDRPC